MSGDPGATRDDLGGTRIFGLYGARREVVTLGLKRHPLTDLYYYLISISWGRLLSVFCGTYVVVSGAFALLYLGLGGIDNARVGSFSDAFFFSLQTLSSVSFLAMAPHSLSARVLVSLESFTRWLGLVLATGLIFTKFSFPHARILFSRKAVVALHDRSPALMFRLANERSNQILEATIKVMVVLDEVTPDGERVRRVHDLPLWRGESALFALTWKVIHPILPGTPLHGLDAQALRDADADLVVTLTGFDEQLARTIHARHVYRASDVVWNARFREIVHLLPNGMRAIDYRRFHDVVPADAGAGAQRPLRGAARAVK
jgi:inward rectifier potassium channel